MFKNNCQQSYQPAAFCEDSAVSLLVAEDKDICFILFGFVFLRQCGNGKHWNLAAV